jgi:uncharacterized OsmC-like protein
MAQIDRLPGTAKTVDLGHVRHHQCGSPNDAAPDPHDLLNSALAACTALTLALDLRHERTDSPSRPHDRPSNPVRPTG